MGCDAFVICQLSKVELHFSEFLASKFLVRVVYKGYSSMRVGGQRGSSSHFAACTQLLRVIQSSNSLGLDVKRFGRYI